MPCPHKFQQDLNIGYATWEVRTLFIGTFNPSWNVCGNNYAQWFYGRVSNNDFWCILPSIHEQTSLINGSKPTWMAFCERNHIAITDILTSLDNADEQNTAHQDAICGFKDDELSQFDSTTTDIVRILENRPSISQICITRQDLPSFWQDKFNDTINWVNQQHDRNILIKYLRSPSRGARKGVIGPFCDFVANRWLEQGYQVL